MLPVLQLW